MDLNFLRMGISNLFIAYIPLFASLELHSILKECNYMTDVLIVVFVTLVVVVFCMVCISQHKKMTRLLNSLNSERVKEENIRQKSDEIGRKLQISETDSFTVFKNAADTGIVPEGYEQWHNMHETVNQFYPDFISNITHRIPDIDASSLNILYLLKIGLSKAEVARIMGKSRSAITQRLARLEKNMGISFEDL